MRLVRFPALSLLFLFVLCGRIDSAGAQDRPPLIQKIEERLGIPLTMTQREALAAASRDLAQARRQAATEYVRDAAGLFGFGEDFIKEAMPAPGLPVSSVEANVARIAQERLAEELSWDQTKALEAAALKRRSAVLGAQALYASRVSGVTDIPSEEILGMLQAQ